MAEALEPWVEKTMTKLGAVIKAPKLQEKLLRKPPFRFLHDIVTSYIKTTSQLQDLFTEEELDSGKVTEKEAKIQFLQKVITTVQIATKTRLEAKPSKIISGAEPEQTNEFLQALADMASQPAGAVAAAVREAIAGGSAPPTIAQPAAPPPATPPAAVDPPPRAAAAAAAAGGGAAPPVPIVTPLANASDMTAGARPGTATARKAPPAVKTNEVVPERADTTKTVPAAGVIVDRGRAAAAAAGDGDEEKKEDDMDWMKVAERHEQESQKVAPTGGDGQQAKGYLASQAMQAKREQEEAAKKAAEAAAAAADRGEGGIVINARKKADRTGAAMGDSEFSKLREQLQLLTKASNPLGRFLEAIHEDVDTMSRELEMWRTEARTQAAAASEAQRATEESLADVRGQLLALDEQIKDQQQKTNILRATIQKNDATIETLIRMVVNADGGKKK